MGIWSENGYGRRAARTLACAALAAASFGATAAVSSAQTPPTDTPTPTVATTTPTPTSTPMPSAETATPVPTVPAVTPTAAPAATPFVSGIPCATDSPNAPGHVHRSDRHGQDDEDDGGKDEFQTGNGRNQVIVHNCTESRLRVGASIQLNTIPGHKVRPLNLAYAEGSCPGGCQTFAVALQIDLYSGERATDVQPENYAVAINSGCNGCITVARAIQYVQPLDDPRDVARDIDDTVSELDRELNAIEADPDISLADAEARLNAVLVRFNKLGGTLGDQREERVD